MLSRPWPRRLTPDRAKPWFGEPPPRCLTSCYDRLRQTLRRPLELGVGVIRRGGDRQNPADRLDPVDGAVLVDEGDHGLNPGASAGRGKKGDGFGAVFLSC